MSGFLSITSGGSIAVAQEKLAAIGHERLQSWVQWSLGDISDDFIAHVRTHYLSGQRLNVVSGQTRDHIGAWIQRKVNGRRAGVNVIRPGKGIDGLQNYLERWTGTRHEFMRPAFESFGAGREVTRQIEENIARQIRRVENEK